jgi:hypothetical protein
MAAKGRCISLAVAFQVGFSAPVLAAAPLQTFSLPRWSIPVQHCQDAYGNVFTCPVPPPYGGPPGGYYGSGSPYHGPDGGNYGIGPSYGGSAGGNYGSSPSYGAPKRYGPNNIQPFVPWTTCPDPPCAPIR